MEPKPQFCSFFCKRYLYPRTLDPLVPFTLHARKKIDMPVIQIRIAGVAFGILMIAFTTATQTTVSNGIVETVVTTRSNEFVCDTPGETRKCIISHGEGIQTCHSDLSWETDCVIQVCTRGRYLAENACQLCPTGTYKDTTSIDPCTRCVNAPRAHTKYINIGEVNEECAYTCLEGYTRLCIRWQDGAVIMCLLCILACFLAYTLFHSGVIRANSSSIEFAMMLSNNRKNAEI